MYKLIAFDVDNTLLNSQKEITPHTIEMIKMAAKKGCNVLLCSGRSLAESRVYYEMIPEMQFFIGNSGSVIVDMHKKEHIFAHPFDVIAANCIYNEIKDLDCMITIHAGEELYINSEHKNSGDYYGVRCYDKLFNDTATWVEDISDIVCKREDIYKIDLFFHSQQGKYEGMDRLRKLGLEIYGATSTNLEVVPGSCNKGSALLKLCEYLNIPPELSAACGDGGNDIFMIKSAGLGIAMGNSIKELKNEADVIVSDCDHEGAAEAIEKYIL